MIYHGYNVITPARDEEERIKRAIGSMAAQSVSPYQWVIVSDGSFDGTSTILDAVTREFIG